MGYTHYYSRIADLDRELFKEVVKDFRKVNPVFEHVGFKLGNAFGEDVPTLAFHEISFNGLSECGHKKQDVGLVWPTSNASGVQMMKNGQQAESLDGKWFAGNMATERVCSGDCSYETFSLEQHVTREELPDYRKDDPYIFNCTKTNFRPYDLAVQVCLIIASHHLEKQIRVTSDGESIHWDDARQFCQNFLGYGSDFELFSEEEKKEAETQVKAGIEAEIEKEATKINPDTVAIGDIFVRSWGYDQTNVNYTKVIHITKTGKTAKLQPIGSKEVESMSDMSGRVMPDPTIELEAKYYPIVTGRIKRYSSGNSLYCGDYHKWDGKPDYRSSYA